MSISFWMAIFIAVFLSTTAARPVPLGDQVVAARLREHNQRTEEFKCSKPQNRSYSIKSILPRDQITPSESIYPSYTVIRRCDEGAGCCRSGDKSCRPVATEDEIVVVRVTNIQANQSSIRTLKIEHHVKCACLITSEVPPLLPPKATFK